MERVTAATRVLYAPFLAQMVVTRRCNLRCGYCSEFDRTSAPVATDVLKARMDKLRELGTFAVEMTGGEPMLHPDIFELIRYARRDQGFFRVQLISNAYRLDADKVRRLNEVGLHEMQVSIDGVKPNRTTVKVLEPLRDKLEMIAKVAAFKVVLNSVVGSAPPEEVLEVIDFARSHRFVPRISFVHDDRGQLSLGQDGFALIDQLRQRLGRRFFNGGDYRQRLVATGEAPFKCRAGSRYLYIDEDGMVRWCSQTRTDWGLPLADYTGADLRQQFRTPKSCNARCTVGCVRHCSRYDNWRRQQTDPSPLAELSSPPRR